MRTTCEAKFSILAFAAIVLLFIPAVAQKNSNRPQVTYEVKHDTSLPLREIVKTALPPKPGQVEMREHKSPKHFFHITPGVDPVIQDEYLPAAPITQFLNFDGVNGNQAGAIPPDTNGAVGSTQFVEITNFDYEVFDKATGAVVLGPTRIHNIWSGFGGQCASSDGGDPIVLWDKLAGRWMVEQLEYFSGNLVCVAVSTGADATGTYNRYSFSFGNTLPDYPHLGVWPDAYYLAVNAFGAGFAEPCALDRTAMLAGQTATMVCFPSNSANFGFLPADIDGSTLPPSGAPGHFVELGNTNTTLNEYDFHVDFVNSNNSTFTGPHVITVPTYTVLCGGGGGACVPQPSGGSLLDAIGDRLMFRLAYRNFGDHESMVVGHGVAPSAGASSAAAMRWYELRATPAGSAFTMYQAGTYQNKNVSLFMGSLAMDKAGNIAMGMSGVSRTVDPSILYTGRAPTDPLGKMQAPVIAVKGSAVQSGSNRWGDYSNMSVDPTDDCTFWYTQEYYNKANGGTKSTDWTSHMVSFKFNSCN